MNKIGNNTIQRKMCVSYIEWSSNILKVVWYMNIWQGGIFYQEFIITGELSLALQIFDGLRQQQQPVDWNSSMDSSIENDCDWI